MDDRPAETEDKIQQAKKPAQDPRFLQVGAKPKRAAADTLERKAFTISRLAEFVAESELVKQVGHPVADWPTVILKELVDNALDEAEEAGVAPIITIGVDRHSIVVHDAIGRGIPPETVEKLIDYSARTSSRAAYASPTRGAQGNALQTIIAMLYALAGEDCKTVVIKARGVEHRIAFATDPIRQTPKPIIERRASLVKIGTMLTVLWPNSASSILDRAKRDFLQLAETFTWLNPHLRLSLIWNGERVFEAEPTVPNWTRWRPSAPTSAHWYNPETLQRLVGAEVAFAEDHGLPQRPVRDFIADFRGLSGTAKTKAICDSLGLSRRSLADVVTDPTLVARLLAAMKEGSRAVKPKDLGIIGRDHLHKRFVAAGAQEDSFDYQINAFDHDGLPYVIEVAFAYAPGLADKADVEVEAEDLSEWEAAEAEAKAEMERERRGEDPVRRMVTGLNFSPSVGANPFRELRDRQGLDGLLSAQYAGPDEPVIVFVHLTTPRLQFLDKGKSSVALS
jgi:DNA topoisomerase VI subunit B